MTAGGFEPRIVVLLCDGGASAAAAQAGMLGQEQPVSARPVRVPCLARIGSEMILKTLQAGADGVLALGCHSGRCPHRDGEAQAARRFALLRAMLAQFGVDPQRVHMERLGTNEIERPAALMREMADRIRSLGPYDR